jgi:hypothetical protein
MERKARMPRNIFVSLCEPCFDSAARTYPSRDGVTPKCLRNAAMNALVPE